jgi:hypothetical protein
MPKGHAPFAVANKTVNVAVKTILRSPAHGLISGKLLILTVTGRRTGKQHSFPVAYDETPDGITIGLDAAGAKVWWRNLKGEGAPVTVRVRGVVREGHGKAIGDASTGVKVEIRF